MIDNHRTYHYYGNALEKGVNSMNMVGAMARRKDEGMQLVLRERLMLLIEGMRKTDLTMDEIGLILNKKPPSIYRYLKGDKLPDVNDDRNRVIRILLNVNFGKHIT